MYIYICERLHQTSQITLQLFNDSTSRSIKAKCQARVLIIATPPGINCLFRRFNTSDERAAYDHMYIADHNSHKPQPPRHASFTTTVCNTQTVAMWWAAEKHLRATPRRTRCHCCICAADPGSAMLPTQSMPTLRVSTCVSGSSPLEIGLQTLRSSAQAIPL